MAIHMYARSVYSDFCYKQNMHSTNLIDVW